MAEAAQLEQLDERIKRLAEHARTHDYGDTDGTLPIGIPHLSANCVVD